MLIGSFHLDHTIIFVFIIIRNSDMLIDPRDILIAASASWMLHASLFGEAHFAV
jgi:hypothetical protein